MAYQSDDLDKWLGTLFSDTSAQKWEDPLTHTGLASRYGLGTGSTSPPRYDDLANDLISAARRNGANLSHDRWTMAGLQGALRYASPLASVDAARGYNMANTNPNAAGEPLYDTSLFGTNAKGRIADFLNTGSLFNRGATGVGAATAIGAQELPGVYQNVVRDIGDKYTAPGMERYANASGTQFGLEALLNSIYGGGVANQIATDTLRRGYDVSGNPFTHYYNSLFGGDRNFTPQPTGGGVPPVVPPTVVPEPVPPTAGGGNGSGNGGVGSGNGIPTQDIFIPQLPGVNVNAPVPFTAPMTPEGQQRIDQKRAAWEDAHRSFAPTENEKVQQRLNGLTWDGQRWVQVGPSEEEQANMIAAGWYWDPAERRWRND